MEAGGRPATVEEQATLARWSGWGAIPGVFDDNDDRWETERQALSGLLDESEWATARRTVLNAHYTDPAVVSAVWEAAEAFGFEAGRVLEPGCGSGNFMAYAPPGAAIVGVERDPVTAAIAGALYPDATIHAQPFERFDSRTPFDLVVGNVPFAGDVVPADARYNRGRHTLHNYFLVKALQLVRPGGLMMALTSRYTLDSRSPAARRELGLHGDLLGALRLPNRSMAAIAGTDAIVDLLILRRREPGAEPGGVAGWDRVVEVTIDDDTTGEPSTTEVNRYLAERPDRVLGEPLLGRGLYRSGEYMVKAAVGTDLAAGVRGGLAAIVADAGWRYEPAAVASPDREARSVSRVGDTELRGERVTPLRNGSFVVSLTGVIHRHVDGDLYAADVPKSATHEVRSLIELRDRTQNLLHHEASDAADGDIEAARAALRTSYEAYVDRWGPLNRVSWARTGKVDKATGDEVRRRVRPRLGGFRVDPEWATLAAIESYDEDTGVATPATIQRQRTIHPPRRALGAETADEALAITLDERGRVDLDRVAELLGVDSDAARVELGPYVYDDPTTGALIPAEEYLSGNVSRKLTVAEAAATTDERFRRNADALRQVRPRQIEPGEITAQPGVPWVNEAEVSAFLQETLRSAHVEARFTPSLGTWTVEAGAHIRYTAPVRSDWGTGRMPAYRLFEATLNQRLVRVYDTNGDRRVLNTLETTAARDKQERFAQRFAEWVWEDPTRAAEVAGRYNDLFNSYVAPDYDGAHLTFPGLTSTFVPHAHQRAAVARILREGRALLAHSVGAGKTATMVMAGMELRRLGTVNRPAYVVPNHMLEQFSRELLQLYPQARVLVATEDLTGREGRKEFIARATTGDWDAVVITHSAFERLPLQVETYEAYVDDRTRLLRQGMANAAKGDDAIRLIKRMEAAIAREEARMERLLDAASKDDGVSFEATGIDYLFIDELHLFKNKAVVTGVDGVASVGSKRAIDLDAKLWHLHRSGGTRVLTGATATPIANSITEAWVMQTYVQPDVLAETGLDRFDAWAATFAQQVPAVELAPDGGSYRMTSRLARYRNVPELIAQFRRTADVRVRGDLDLTLPALRGGRPETVVVEASDGLTDYVTDLVQRAEDIRNGRVKPDIDNMLKVTSDGRHAALDLRLVDMPPDPTGGKVAAAAERIAAIHRDTRHLAYLDATGQPAARTGAFQLVFCDLATPTDDGFWNAYDELKRRLVTAGLAPSEVAFVHDAKNDDARAQLFERCRNGQVAVLVGSTQKMGVGTNIHARAIALHHLDCPWRPADIEQREGRIIRQGNQNTDVEIIRYATEASFDVYMWQTCERKAGFIDQVMRSTGSGRDLDDVGDAVLSYAEVKALATGNPLVIEQAGVQADIAKLDRLASAHRAEQARLVEERTGAERDAGRAHARAASYEGAMARRIDTTGDRFRIELDGTTHTERIPAGTILLARLDAARQTLLGRSGSHADLPPRTIGRLAGFPVEVTGYRLGDHIEFKLSTRISDDETMDVRIPLPDLAAKKPDVLVTQLEGPIRRLDTLRDQALAEAERCTQRASDAAARIGQPFPDQKRLTDLRRRYREILDALNPAPNEPPAPTSEATPSTTSPAARLDALRDPEPLGGSDLSI